MGDHVEEPISSYLATNRSKREFLINLSAGGLAGLTADASTHAIDTVRTRLQVQVRMIVYDTNDGENVQRRWVPIFCYSIRVRNFTRQLGMRFGRRSRTKASAVSTRALE
jgi:hypothetical protein